MRTPVVFTQTAIHQIVELVLACLLFGGGLGVLKVNSCWDSDKGGVRPRKESRPASEGAFRCSKRKLTRPFPNEL